MREKIKDKGRLEHIMQAIDTLLKYKKVYTADDIKGNPIIFFGFVKGIEIIGEAVYMLSKDFRAAHPEVEWSVIEGMRHVLVHGYYSIKLEQVLRTVEDDIPTLKMQIENILSTMNE